MLSDIAYGYTWQPWNAVLSVVLFLATAVLAILASRAGFNAQSLERSRASLDGFDFGRRNDRERATLRLLAAHKHSALSRNRALGSTVYAVLFLTIGIFFLIYFALSANDFIYQYYSGTRSDEWLESYEYQIIAQGLVGTALAAWGLSLLFNARAASREAEALEVELELMRYPTTEQAERARKLFVMNQQMLKKYYDGNRAGSAVATMLSVLCIIAAIAVTWWTIGLVTDPERAAVSQWVVGAIGAANAIMINVVAAILLRMQTSIWTNVNSFHERLVRTQEIFLANAIVAEIDDPRERRSALAAVASSLGSNQAAPRTPNASGAPVNGRAP